MRKALIGAAMILTAAFLVPRADSQCNPYTQGSWAARASIPVTYPGVVRAWGAWFPANGRFYSLGGRTSDAAGSDILNPLEYDPGANAWTTKAAAFADNQVNNMVGGVVTLGATTGVVLVGGSAAGATTATSAVRFYDPVGDTMTALSSDSWPGNVGGTVLPGGAAVSGGKLYVFGGYNINVGMTTAIYQFDPAAAAGARWTTKAAVLPTAQGYIPTATSGAYIYLLGGSQFSGGTLVDSTVAYRYDPVGDAITSIAAVPRAVGETRAVTHPYDSSVWVLGGGRTAPNPVTEVDVYFPGSNTWGTAPAMTTARRNFSADIDPATGRIFAAGGYVGGVADPTAEQFTCVVPVELMRWAVE